MDDAVIVSAVRTAIGEAGKTLAPVPAWDLAEIACREAIERAGIDPAVFDEVILGETIGGGGSGGRGMGDAGGGARAGPGYTVVPARDNGREAGEGAHSAVGGGVGAGLLHRR